MQNQDFTVEFYQGATLLGSQTVSSLGAEALTSVAISTTDLSITNDIRVEIVSAENAECQTENNTSMAAFVSLNVADIEGLTDQQDYLINVHNVNEAPEINNLETSVDAAISSQFTYQIDATDSDLGDQITYRLDQAPEGMLINSLTGEITWTPTESQGPSESVIVVAEDLSGEIDTIELTINIDVGLLPPEITSDPVTEFLLQSPDFVGTYEYDVGATDPDGDSNLIEFSLQISPPDMSIDLQSGLITWALAIEDVGRHDVTVRATDADGLYIEQSYTIDVTEDSDSINSPPLIISDPIEFHNLDPNLSSPTPQRLDEWQFEQWVSVTNGNSVWVFDEDGFRVSQNTNAQGSVLVGDFDPRYVHIEGTWEVATTGDDDFVGFSFGYESEYRQYLFNWKQGSQSIAFAGMSLISLDLAQDGSDGPVAVAGRNTVGATSLYHNDIPWLDFVEYNYSLGWDPSAGLIRIAVFEGDEIVDAFVVRDSTFSDGSFAIYNESQQSARYRVSVSNSSGIGQYWYDVEAIDPDGDELTYRIVTAPPDVWINANTGTIFWDVTEENIGTHEIVVEVEDPFGETDQQVYDLVIVQEGPAIVSTPPKVTNPDKNYLYALTAFDPTPNDILTYSLVDAPSAMNINAATGLIEWTPTTDEIGEHFITVSVADAFGFSATQSYVLLVQEAEINSAPQFTSQPPSTIVLGNSFAYTPTAIDADGDSIAFALAGVVPSGLEMFNGVDVTWTPTADQLGAYEVMLNAIDGRGAVTTQLMRIEVTDGSGSTNNPPTIDSSPIFGGNADQDFTYQVIASDPDGDSVTIELSQSPTNMSIDSSGLIFWPAADITLGNYPVVITATDPLGASATQSFTLNIAENGSPSITSTPVTQTLPGELYSYAVTAVDPENDDLSFSLLSNPAEMAISAEGLISWTAQDSDIGVQTVTVQVSDTQANTASQTFNITVADNTVPNRSPEVTGDLVRGARVDVLYQIAVPITDPDGDTLTFSTDATIDGLSLSTDGVITWTPTSDQLGEHIISITASDGEFGVTLTSSIVVDAGAVPLDVSAINISPSASMPGQPVLISVVPQGGNGTITVQADINGTPLTLENGEVYVSRDVPGRYDVSVTVTDETGESVTASSFFTIVDTTDSTAPFVDITNPVSGATITELTDIIATIEDDNLANYSVFLKRRGQPDNEAALIAEGTQNVINNFVATLDPSSQLNGLYDIIVEATDYSGQTSSSSVGIRIDEDLKVGNFSFTVVDMEVPLAGIPIRVTRTYDSRRRNELLDFGYGWTIGYQDVRVEESRAPGRFWTEVVYRTGPAGLIANFCIEPTGDAPIVTVTLPDGQQEEFEVSVSPRCLTSASLPDTRMEFTPLGDTQSTLELIGNNTVRLDQNTGNLVEIDGFEPFDPHRYRLTTEAGFIYDINQNFGIEQVITPNNHTITYTDDGIFHSGGKSVTFERDSTGKIQRIIDPMGHEVNYTYDSVQDLRIVTDQVGAQVQYTYNRNHGLLDIIDPLGRTLLKNIYDDNGKLIAQEDGEGHITNFNHDLAGRVSVVTNRDNEATTFEYDEEGNVLTEIKAARGIVYTGDIRSDYQYDANGNQTYSAVGGAEFATTASFDDDNHQLTSTNALGQTVEYRDYNSLGQEGSIVDERGHVHDMHYDSVGNLLSIEGPEYTDPITGELRRNVATNVVNSRGLPTSTTDMRGTVTTFTYYPEGHPWEDQKQTESTEEGGTTTYTYDDNLNVISETRERTVDGVVVEETMTNAYDARNRLIRTTYPDGTYTQTEYDIIGNVARERDRFGNWTEMTYDIYNRVIGTQYPDGTSETTTYSPEGKMLTSTDRDGHVTRYEYDDFGRQWRVHFEPANDEPATFTETQYTPQGWVQFEWDENRNLTEYTYDEAGRRQSVIRHGEGTTLVHQFDYYANGELLSETDALNHTTTYILNELDQRVETQYHNGTRMQAQFDEMGTRIRAFDQNDRATRFDIDDLGPPSWRAAGSHHYRWRSKCQLTTYSYDEVGNKLTQTDAEQRTTRWTYDYFGRVASRTLPMLQEETTTYDDIARTISHTDFNGQTTVTQLDVMGRTTRIDYHDGQFEAFTYTADGQTETVETLEGVTTYTYYAQGWLQSETRPNGSVLEYQYDPVGNRTQVSVTRDGITRVTDYTYDDFNRLFEVIDSAGTTSYSYDDVGNMASVSYPNGLVTQYTYNTINQLTRVDTFNDSGQVIGGYTYTLGATGRREEITEDSGRITDYVYDNLYRLVEETITDDVNGNYSAEYQYDWVGNRTFETVDGVSTAYTYDDNDRLTQTGGTTYTHDASGNTLTETLDGNVTTYTYDAKHKMRSVEKAGVTTEYDYNYRGMRTAKTEAGVTTHFILDENRDYAQVLREVTDGATTVEYVYGHDLSVAKPWYCRSLLSL